MEEKILNNEEKEWLWKLLKASGRCSTSDKRQALIREVGKDPGRFNIEVTERDFAINFIDELIGAGDRETLKKIVERVGPDVPRYKQEVSKLRAKFGIPEPAIKTPDILRDSGKNLRRPLLCPLLMSAGMAILTILLRSTGWLQGCELRTYDFLMNTRLPESEVWKHVTVVGITDEDLKTWRTRGRISYEKLNKLLDRLQQKDYSSHVIGLDIYLDPPNPTSTKYEQLVETVCSHPVLATCRVKKDGFLGTIPPCKADEKNRPKYLGFSDIVKDNINNDSVRRHLLLMENPRGALACDTEYALSYKLAVSYLAKNGIKPYWDKNWLVLGSTERGWTFFEPLDVNKSLFSFLFSRTGGYQKVDPQKGGYEIEGYQIMLNYRTSDPKPVTFKEVIDGTAKDRIDDRIVLIGYTSQTEENKEDLHITPYSRNNSLEQKRPGVFLHAHMTSQIVSAVLDNRPLIRVWSPLNEWLWTVMWSVFSGVLIWLTQNLLIPRLPKELTVWVITAVVFIFVIGIGIVGWFLLGYAGIWAPLIPPAIASGLTGVGILSLNGYRNRREARD